MGHSFFGQGKTHLAWRVAPQQVNLTSVLTAPHLEQKVVGEELLTGEGRMPAGRSVDIAALVGTGGSPWFLLPPGFMEDDGGLISILLDEGGGGTGGSRSSR